MPGALRTAPYPATGKGFEFRLVALHYAARAASALLSLATILYDPITVVSCRAKAKSFRPSSILFRPHHMPLPQGLMQRHMVEAPGTAPGSDRLITTAFITIAGKPAPGI